MREKSRINNDEMLKLFCEKIDLFPLIKYEDKILYDYYDHNSFCLASNRNAEETKELILGAFNYQLYNAKNFLKVESYEPLTIDGIVKSKYFYYTHIVTMALIKELNIEVNNEIEIVSLKEYDCCKDIIKLELEEYGQSYGEDFVKRKVDYLTHKAQILDGFDYWAVLYNKKVVGYCYSYQNKDSILIDNLLIAQDYRKQHIASSLINHINKISGEKVVMLHADKDNYPYSIYKKLGFEVIDNIYEYLWVGLQK